MKESRLLRSSINIFSLLRAALLVVVLGATAAVFIGTPVRVSGESMEPNFQSGNVVFVEKLSYWDGAGIRRFDVVAAKFPADPKRTRLIKRVIGLPGEEVTVANGAVRINGAELTLPHNITAGEPTYQVIESVILGENEYYLIGDNRPGSSDSRLWGPVQRDDIQGRVSLVLFPLTQTRFLLR